MEATALSAGDTSNCRRHGWTFLTTHAVALICIARDPNLRLRDIAAQVGVTERTAFQIVDDLVASGYASRSRHGNRNAYTVYPDLGHRSHPKQLHDLGTLAALLGVNRGGSGQ